MYFISRNLGKIITLIFKRSADMFGLPFSKLGYFSHMFSFIISHKFFYKYLSEPHLCCCTFYFTKYLLSLVFVTRLNHTCFTASFCSALLFLLKTLFLYRFTAEFFQKKKEIALVLRNKMFGSISESVHDIHHCSLATETLLRAIKVELTFLDPVFNVIVVNHEL